MTDGLGQAPDQQLLDLIAADAVLRDCLDDIIDGLAPARVDVVVLLRRGDGVEDGREELEVLLLGRQLGRGRARLDENGSDGDVVDVVAIGDPTQGPDNPEPDALGVGGLLLLGHLSSLGCGGLDAASIAFIKVIER